MPKVAKELKQQKINSLPDGRHAVGGVRGLYVAKVNGKISFWMLKDRQDAKKTIYYPRELTLAQVREQARIDLMKKRQGEDPKAERRALMDAQKKQKEMDVQKELEASFTLRVVTEAWFDYQKSEFKRWYKKPRDEKRERQRIEKHILKAFGDRPISTITSQEMAKLFNQIYSEKYETAKKLLAHVRGIFSFASSSKKFGTVPDPFDRDFDELTKGARRNNKKMVRNHPALPFEEVPSFIKALLEKGDNVSLAIAFSILTATRNQAIRLASWKEIDFKEGKWVIPQEHDKNHSPEEKYRTAFLSKQAIEFLKLLSSKQDGKLLFPPNPSRPSKPMQDATLSRHIKIMHRQKKTEDGKGWIDPKIIDEETGEPSVITQHGTARASFRTWGQDDVNGNLTRFDERAVELCIFHKQRDPYKGGYQRHSIETMRRKIMQAWSDYCLKGIKLKDYFLCKD